MCMIISWHLIFRTIQQSSPKHTLHSLLVKHPQSSAVVFLYSQVLDKPLVSIPSSTTLITYMLTHTQYIIPISKQLKEWITIFLTWCYWQCCLNWNTNHNRNSFLTSLSLQIWNEVTFHWSYLLWRHDFSSLQIMWNHQFPSLHFILTHSFFTW